MSQKKIFFYFAKHLFKQLRTKVFLRSTPEKNQKICLCKNIVYSGKLQRNVIENAKIPQNILVFLYAVLGTANIID
jgi:hypothetical protein